MLPLLLLACVFAQAAGDPLADARALVEQSQAQVKVDPERGRALVPKVQRKGLAAGLFGCASGATCAVCAASLPTA